MSLEDILGKLEGAIPPEALKGIAAELGALIKGKESEFVQATEQKYGVPAAVVSDVEKTVQDAAPAATQAVESVLPPDIAQLIRDQAAQLKALTAQVDALKAGAANQTSVVMGQGEPVPHTLFLEDGSIVTGHAGLATSYSTPDPTDPTKDIVKKVVAAYPTA